MSDHSLDDSLDIQLTVKKEDKPENEGHLTVDVFRDGKDIVVQSTIAGADPNTIDISVTTETVTIRGYRERERSIKTLDYYHRELFWGSFSRSVILPEDVDPDKSKASYKNGILTIKLPIVKSGNPK